MKTKQKDGYISAFDGIRALAIVMILIFHYRPAGFEMLRGGFIGVDIFFVLSGYLITMLLLGEKEKTETISLKKFWLMRARRLLPAVFTLIIIMTLLAVALPGWKGQLEESSASSVAKYLPDMTGESLTIKSQIIPAVAYFINWHFIFAGGSYFELMDRPSLFGHLWSLAIEEQFYLIWPVLLWLIFRIFGKGNNFLAIVILALGGFSAYSLYANGQATPLDARAYFGTDSRAYALMLGALLSIYFKPHQIREKVSYVKTLVADAFGIFGLVLLGYLAWHLTGGELFIFRGGLFLATLATAVVIISCLNVNSVVVKGLLGNRVFGWIGKRSYGLYLWHWPVFVLTESHYNYPVDGLALLALRSALLLGIVEVSYRFVENPIRYGAIGKYWSKFKTSAGVERMKLASQLSVMGLVTISVFGFCVVSLAQTKQEAIVSAKLEVTPSDGEIEAPVIVNQMEPATVAVSESEDKASQSLEIMPMDPPLQIEEAKPIDITPMDPLPEREEIQMPEIVVPTEATTPAQVTDTPKIADSPVLALGDSVMLGSATDLKKEIKGIKVDAVVGRQFTDLEKIVANMKQSKKIPSLVFIHTGNNGTVEEPLFVQMMELLKDCERVVIFTVRVPRSWQNSNNEIFARVVPRYPNAVLVDWQKESSGKVEFFAKDGIHLKAPQGTGYYVSLVKQALLNGLKES